MKHEQCKRSLQKKGRRISKNELQRRYLDGEYYMAMPFGEYVTRFEVAGCEVVDDDGIHENNEGQV